MSPSRCVKFHRQMLLQQPLTDGMPKSSQAQFRFVSRKYCYTNGKKTSCPVAVLDVRIPMTNPFRSLNQRLVITTPSTADVNPVPIPIISPHNRENAQVVFIHPESPAPIANNVSAYTMTRLIPYSSIMAAAKGQQSPYKARLIANGKVVLIRSHPNAFSKGRISTPGAERTPADTKSVKNTTAIAIHP